MHLYHCFVVLVEYHGDAGPKAPGPDTAPGSSTPLLPGPVHPAHTGKNGGSPPRSVVMCVGISRSLY